MAKLQQLPNGRWLLRYELPPDPLTGKRRQRKKTFASEEEGQAWYAALKARIDASGGVYDDALTLAAFSELWLERQHERMQRGIIRPSTIYFYRNILKNMILPYLGRYRLADLTTEALMAWHDTLARERDHKPSTINRAHGILHHILRDAERRGAVERNVAKDAWPEMRSTRSDGWTLAETRRFLDWCKSEPEDIDPAFVLLCHTAVLTGLRVGELLALEWSDLNLRAGTLSVNRTQTRGANGGWLVGPPKTAAGRRTLHLPRDLVARLRQYRSDQFRERLRQPGWWGHDLVFCRMHDGGPFQRAHLSDAVRRCCDLAGVPRVTPHQFRRAAAMLMVALGFHPRVIQARLGHETIAMSMEVYAQVPADLDAEATRAFDSLDGLDAGDDPGLELDDGHGVNA